MIDWVVKCLLVVSALVGIWGAVYCASRAYFSAKLIYHRDLVKLMENGERDGVK